MDWLKGHFYLQFVQIAIGIVVAWLVWQNGRRQIDNLDKKLGMLVAMQFERSDYVAPTTEQGGYDATRQGFGARSFTGEAMQAGNLIDPHDESFIDFS